MTSPKDRRLQKFLEHFPNPRKAEIRSTKSETNPNYKCSNVQNMETKLFDMIMVVNSVLVICILKIENLFRPALARRVWIILLHM